MSYEKLSPGAAVRLLRAKGAQWEYVVLNGSLPRGEADLMADIALVAQLLADHIERTSLTGEGVGAVVGEEDRNLPTAGGNASRNPSTSQRYRQMLTDRDIHTDVPDRRIDVPEVW